MNIAIYRLGYWRSDTGACSKHLRQKNKTCHNDVSPLPINSPDQGWEEPQTIPYSKALIAIRIQTDQETQNDNPDRG